jgi:type IV secretion system protein VirB2
MKKSTIHLNKAWQLSFAAMFAVAFVLLPDMAFAGSTSSVGTALCDVADAFQGNVASGIATIAICTIGAMACLGRVQWTTAIVVGTGIAVLFGATALVSTVSGGTGTGC